MAGWLVCVVGTGTKNATFTDLENTAWIYGSSRERTLWLEFCLLIRVPTCTWLSNIGNVVIDRSTWHF